MRLYMY